MLVTKEELVVNIRAVREDLQAVAKDLGGDIKECYRKMTTLENRINELELLIRERLSNA